MANVGQRLRFTFCDDKLVDQMVGLKNDQRSLLVEMALRDFLLKHTSKRLLASMKKRSGVKLLPEEVALMDSSNDDTPVKVQPKPESKKSPMKKKAPKVQADKTPAPSEKPEKPEEADETDDVDEADEAEMKMRIVQTTM